MANQILVGKGTNNPLISSISTPFSLINGFSTKNNSKGRSSKAAVNSKHTRPKTHGSKPSDSDVCDSSQSKINKATNPYFIPDTLKKRLMKIIDNNFDNNIRQFSNVAWAYLDIPEDVLIDDERMYFFNLLFGPENVKSKLFKKLRKNKTNGRSINKNCKNSVPDSSAASKNASPIHSGNKQTFNINRNYFNKTELIRDDITSHLETKLMNVCASFFKRHGLVVKVRKLPLDYTDTSMLPNRRTARYYGSSSYPSYHFIARQRRHLVEQIMRSRSFFETEYNSYNELRNFRSPFLLFEPHSNFLKYLQDIKKDLNDADFSGLFISLNTLPHKSNTELGDIKRSKLIAWCLIEILSNNERCLNCLWVNPVISATGTTDLLRAFIPFAIITSFSVILPNVHKSYKKVFYIWLTDFDHFPRQALILFSSPYRFALEKHFDSSDEYQEHTHHTLSSFYSKFLYENNINNYFPFGYSMPRQDSLNDKHLFSDHLPTSHRLMKVKYPIKDVMSMSNNDEDDEDVDESDEYMDLIFKRYLKEYIPHKKKDAKRCECYNDADWNDVDKIILSCSEEMMIDSIPRWLQLIRKYSSYLEEDLDGIINQKETELETSYEVKAAEFAKLENNHIQDLLMNLYGSKWSFRLKLKYIKMIKAEEHTQRRNMYSPKETNGKNKQ